MAIMLRCCLLTVEQQCDTTRQAFTPTGRADRVIRPYKETDIVPFFVWQRKRDGVPLEIKEIA